MLLSIVVLLVCDYWRRHAVYCLYTPNRYVQVQNVTSLAARKSVGHSNAVVDSVLLEAGQPGGDVAGEHVVYVELGVDWTSFRSKVMAKIDAAAALRCFVLFYNAR